MTDALIDAIRSDDPVAIDHAIDAGVDVNRSRDRHGRSAVELALVRDREDAVRRLIARGAVVEREVQRVALDLGAAAFFEALRQRGDVVELSQAERLAAVVAHPRLGPALLKAEDAAAPPSEDDYARAEDWDWVESLAPLSASALHALVEVHNWDGPNEGIVELVRHPRCAPLTARLAWERSECARSEAGAAPSIAHAIRACFPQLLRSDERDERG